MYYSIGLEKSRYFYLENMGKKINQLRYLNRKGGRNSRIEESLPQ